MQRADGGQQVSTTVISASLLAYRTYTGHRGSVSRRQTAMKGDGPDFDNVATL